MIIIFLNGLQKSPGPINLLEYGKRVEAFANSHRERGNWHWDEVVLHVIVHVPNLNKFMHTQSVSWFEIPR